MECKQNKQHIYFINYHLLWCTKRRQPVLFGKVKSRLLQILKKKAKQIGIDITEFELMPNHIHIFVLAHPLISVHKIIKSFKAISSNILRKEFPHLLKLPSLWTHSYFVSTTRNINNEMIRKFVEAQSKK